MLTPRTSNPPTTATRSKAAEKRRDLAFLKMKSILDSAEEIPLGRLWRIEWHPRQQAHHVEPPETSMQRLRRRWERPGLGWELVGFATNENDAHKLVDLWEVYTQS